MSSIVTAILNATVGLLVNKVRDLLAENLKDGDIADQQVRKLVVRELEDIKSKIDGLARVNLLASLSFFKEGLVFLYQWLDQPEYGEVNTATAREGTEDEKLAVSLPSARGGSQLSVNTNRLVEGLKMLKLNQLNETAKQLLADAKKKFEYAGVEATRAFNNEALQISERILAMKIRMIATLMEKVDCSFLALASCRLCLEELHKTPVVQNCFEVEITKPVKYRFNKKERRKVIAEVCQMNFVVYSVTKMVSSDWLDVFRLPCVDIGKLKIDPLRDVRLTKALSEFKLERCCLVWTFDLEGEVNYRLHLPQSITTNTQGQFIVAACKGYVKVLDSSGKFVRSVCPLTDDEQRDMTFRPTSVATDGNGNLYVLVLLEKGGRDDWYGVYVFDQHENLVLNHKFPLRKEVAIKWRCQLTVSNDSKVFVLVKCDGVHQVDVYETDGKFGHSFGQGILSSSWASDITTAKDDRVMVLDRKSHCVHVFSTQGDHLHQFGVQGDTQHGAIAFHQPSEHVFISSSNPDNENRGQVSIYTKDGEFVHSVQLDTHTMPWLEGLTVTVDGRIAVANYYEDKVHIIPY